jgi:hypothetical protein
MWEAMSHPSFNTWHAVSASENRLKWRSNWNDIVGGPEKTGCKMFQVHQKG